MKKRIGILVFFTSILIILQINTTNGLEKNEITFNNLSSQNFLSFVKEKNIAQKISKICTNDFCDFVRGKNIDDSFNKFILKYEEYLTTKTSEENAHSTILKGFNIKSVNVLD